MVRITHAAHPLRGQDLLIVSQTGGGRDPTQILVQLPGGERRFIPIAWTNLGDVTPTLPGGRFAIEQLVRLRGYLDDLVDPPDERIMTIENRLQDVEGGSHGQFSDHALGTVEYGRAPAGDSHAGADVDSLSGTGAGGGK